MGGHVPQHIRQMPQVPREPIRPYDPEVTSRWLAKRAHLRQIRDNPDTPKAQRWQAINELESGA